MSRECLTVGLFKIISATQKLDSMAKIYGNCWATIIPLLQYSMHDWLYLGPDEEEILETQ